MKLESENSDKSIAENILPFNNLTDHVFSDKQIVLLNKDPSYIPINSGYSDLSNIAMIKASTDSLKCQLHKLENITEETSNNPSILSSK